MSMAKNKRSNWAGTAFMVEALVLLAVLVACMAVFTQLFAYALTTAQESERTSSTVIAAQNAAEEFSADPESVYASKPVGEGVAENGADGQYVSCDVTKTAQAAGTMYAAHITVSDNAGVAYELDATRYVSGVN